MRVDELSKKFSKSIRAYDAYQQQLEYLTQRRDALRRTVGQAKYRLKLKPEVSEVLDEMRMRSHKRVLGTIENLLTAALIDVMGDHNCKVSLSLDTTRGLPDLQFSIHREYNGKRVEEDILHANGLSYSNVLSTALRVIAMESGHMRRFLLLDETDKYISPDTVQYYATMIKNLAQDFNTQILMISHHSTENFAGCNITRIKRVKPGDDGVNTVVMDIQNPYPEWTEKDVGIRSLHMINFESHADTRIFLSPRVSVLQGANGLGKSSVHRALYALAGQSSDSIIRHFCDEAIVEAEVKGDQIVRVSRHRSRNPKVLFSLFSKSDMSKPLKQENSSKGAPDWVVDLLGLRPLNGIEVQLCWQGDPFFLLDKTGSKAAELLSLGKESDYIKDMELAYKAWVTQDKYTVKHGEITLGQMDARILLIKETMNRLRYLPDMEESINRLKESETFMDRLAKLYQYLPVYQRIGDDMDISFLSDDTAMSSHINSAYTELCRAEKTALNISAYANVSETNIPAIERYYTELAEHYSHYYKAEKVGRWFTIYSSLYGCDIHDVDHTFFDADTAHKITVMTSTLESVKAYKNVHSYVLPDYVLTLRDPPSGMGILQEMTASFTTMNALQTESAKVIKDEKLAESQWLAWVSANGGVCPACDQPFNVTHYKHSDNPAEE